MQTILFVTDSLVAGGIEAQLVELATRLDRSRFAPEIVCLYGPPIRDVHFLPRLHDVEIPVSFLGLDLTTPAKALGLKRIASMIRFAHPAIVQAENYHANLLTRLTRAISSPLLPQFKLVGSVRGVLSTKQLFYEQISQRYCDAVVVNAPQLRSMLEQQASVPAAKIAYIPNGIDLHRFAPDQSELRRADLAPGAKRIFLVMGRISAEKNIHLTIEAFGLLKRRNELSSDVRLVIVGPVQEVDAQRLIDQAVKADGLQNIVIQHGATLHPEEYYRNCDACIVYSSPVKPPAEGLPSVILEAMAVGKPVIVSDIANAAGVVMQGVNGWIVPAQNVEALAHRIKTITATPDTTLRRMGADATSQAQGYGVERMVGLYEALYERLTIPR